MADTTSPFGTDFLGAQDELNRKKAFAQLLMQRATTTPQGQMVSGHFVAPSVAAQLQPLISAFMGNRMQEQIGADTKNLQQMHGQQLRKELETYFPTREGAPGQTMTDAQAGDLLNNDQNVQLADPVKADPRKAAILALTSQLPEMQEIGKADIAGMAKQENETFSTPTTFKDPTTGKLVTALIGNRGNVRPITNLAPAPDSMNVDGRVVDKHDPTQVIADYREEFGQPYQRGGDWYQKDSRGKEYKLDNAPNVKVSVGGPIIKGQNAGMETWAKVAGERVGKSGEQAQNAVNLVGTLQQLSKLSDSGVFNGPASGAATWLGGLLQSAGMPADTSKVANSQSYNATAKEAVQQLIGQYGGNRGITAEEAAQLQVVIPQLDHSPDARRQLTAILTNVANRRVQDYRTASHNYGKALKADDPELFDMTDVMLPNSEPLAPANGGGSVMTLDQYIKAKTGGGR